MGGFICGRVYLWEGLFVGGVVDGITFSGWFFWVGELSVPSATSMHEIKK